MFYLTIHTYVVNDGLTGESCFVIFSKRKLSVGLFKSAWDLLLVIDSNQAKSKRPYEASMPIAHWVLHHFCAMVSVSREVPKKLLNIKYSAVNSMILDMAPYLMKKAFCGPMKCYSLWPLLVLKEAYRSFNTAVIWHSVLLRRSKNVYCWRNETLFLKPVHYGRNRMKRTPRPKTEFQKSVRRFGFCSIQCWKTWRARFKYLVLRAPKQLSTSGRLLVTAMASASALFCVREIFYHCFKHSPIAAVTRKSGLGSYRWKKLIKTGFAAMANIFVKISFTAVFREEMSQAKEGYKATCARQKWHVLCTDCNEQRKWERSGLK